MTRALVLGLLLLTPTVARAGGVVVSPAPTEVAQVRLLVIDQGATQTWVVQPVLSGLPGDAVSAWLLPVPGPVVAARASGWNVFGALRAGTTHPGEDMVWVGLIALIPITLWALWRLHRPRWTSALLVLLGIGASGAMLVPNLVEARDGPGYPLVPGLELLDARRLAASEPMVLPAAQVAPWLAGHGLTASSALLADLDTCARDGWQVVAYRLQTSPGAIDAALALPPPLRVDLPRTGSDLLMPPLLGQETPAALEAYVVSSARFEGEALEEVTCLPTARPGAAFRLRALTERPSLAGVAWPSPCWVQRLDGQLPPGRDARLRSDGTPSTNLAIVYGPDVQLPLCVGYAVAAVALVVLAVGVGPRGRRLSRPWWLAAAAVLSWPLAASHAGAALVRGEVGTRVPNSSWAYMKIRSIATSESLFREGDKDGDGALDHGTLDELIATRLVDWPGGDDDEPYASYHFVAIPGPDPELQFEVAATPVFPGAVAYFIDETGIQRRALVLERGGRPDRDDEQIGK